MFSHGYSNGANPWAVGPYATGNKAGRHPRLRDQRQPAELLATTASTPPATRSTPTARSGTAPVGGPPGAGEEVERRATPTTTRQLQLRCAQGTGGDQAPLPPAECPGNRRWIQLMFDAFLLQQGATSMLDARDAMLAADRMRFGGANQEVMWDAFAKRGMGKGASTPDADSGDADAELRLADVAATRRVTLPAARGRQGLRRPLRGPRHPGRRHRSADQARRNVASWRPAATRWCSSSAAARLQAVHADGRRPVSARRVRAHGAEEPRVGQRTAPRCSAPAPGRSTPTSSSTAPRPPTGPASTTATTSTQTQPVRRRRPRRRRAARSRRVQVSAMLRPGAGRPDRGPAAPTDPDSGSRFTALRRFALEACASSCGSAERDLEAVLHLARPTPSRAPGRGRWRRT